MPENWRTVAETPFCVTWQLPGYPGTKPVACGADIAALHCWQQTDERLLIYAKVELTACYESQQEKGEYRFAGTTRYLSVGISVEPIMDFEQVFRVSLAGNPVCTVIKAAQHAGSLERNEVQVEGVIRLQGPTVREKVKGTVPPEYVAPLDRLEQKTGLLPSYTEPQPVVPATGTRVPDELLPDHKAPPLTKPERRPFFPRGAESIPPVIWTMPERG